MMRCAIHGLPDRHLFESDISMSLIKSKKRVADHGEVFTPAWMVEDLYAKYDISASEIAFIEKVVRPMGAIDE